MKMRISRIPGVLIVAAALLAGSAAAAQPRQKLDRVLSEVVKSERGSGKKHRVIVRAAATSRQWLRARLQAEGRAVDAEHPSIAALTVELDAEEIARFCQGLAAIEGCSADAAVHASGDPPHGPKGGREERDRAPRRGEKSTPLTAPVNTLLGNIGLSASAHGGAGVTVALIDSGLHPSSAFAGRIKAFFDFTGGGIRIRRPMDPYGHGTHVAGLIGGVQGPLDREYQGVAPGVNFVVLRVLDERGIGTTSDVIRAIEFATAHATDATLGIDIINLSLGHPIYEPARQDPLVLAVEAASRAGVIVVASAGNFGTNRDTGEVGYAGITSPGNAPSAITVGAYDHRGTVGRADDRVTNYSSRGPTWLDGLAKPDIVGPGHFLVSEASPRSGLAETYPRFRRTGRSGKTFLALSGTSMAAAVTTGVIALLESRTGGQLTPNLAKALLQFTAIPLVDDAGVPYDVLTQGTGGLNAEGALRLAGAIDFTHVGTATPWTVGLSPCGETISEGGSEICSTTIGGRNQIWAQNIIWGQNIVWGDAVYYNLPLWPANIVWGDNIVWADGLLDWDNIVWGNNITWGQNIVWGENIVWGQRLDDNIVWGNSDNIVWGNDDNVVWGHDGGFGDVSLSRGRQR